MTAQSVFGIHSIRLHHFGRRDSCLSLAILLGFQFSNPRVLSYFFISTTGFVLGEEIWVGCGFHFGGFLKDVN
jgi:hypothetical protein